MKLIFYLILIFITTVYSTSIAWKNHVKNFRINFRSYADILEKWTNFNQSNNLINDVNNLNYDFKLDHNEFSTWSENDFELHKGLETIDSPGNVFFESSRYLPDLKRVLPDSVDWIEAGWNTLVRNQLKCGSCWAFAATAAIEAQIWINKNRSVTLSPQELVDCSSSFGNNGCVGGLPSRAFIYTYYEGLELDKSYPYIEKKAKCKANFDNKDDFYLINYKVARSSDDMSLMKLLAFRGPVTVAIDAHAKEFQLYRSGIYSGSNRSVCGRKLDHAVLLVGYGERNGKKYWRIKNQWGSEWGQNGYMDISRDIPNNCGISTLAVVPVIE